MTAFELESKSAPKGTKMKSRKLTTAALSLTLVLGLGSAFAQAATVNGEVKKIDESAGKVTLKHGPVKNLDMEEDGMIMVFRVQNPTMLKQVKVGDKVQFEAERTISGITITKMQKSK
jgi:Cu/Ag efflux protein CusF